MADLYGWVIRSKAKEKEHIFGEREQYYYFADRTSIKNPRYMTSFHDRVKWFDTKEDAEAYWIKKMQKHGSIGAVVSRRKFHLTKEGKGDYWKNRTALLR